MTDTRFTPGPGTAYVTDELIAMTSAGEPDDVVAASCASAVEWSALLLALLDRADAAVVAHDVADGGRLRLALIGDVSVAVDTAAGLTQFAGGAAWAEHEVVGAIRVTLGSGTISDAATDKVGIRHRVDGGIVPASVVSRRLASTAQDAIDPFEALFGHTVVRAVETAAVRHDELHAPLEPAPLGVLVFSTGERVVVDRPILLGRNPREADPDAERALRRVKVASPSVSRRHAMIRIDRWHASIDDLGSSNGTMISLPGRPPKRLQPGCPVDLLPGAIVDLGGDVSFAVEEVA